MGEKIEGGKNEQRPAGVKGFGGEAVENESVFVCGSSPLLRLMLMYC